MIAGSYCWPKRLGIQNRRCWGHTGSWLKIIRMLPALRAALLLPVQLSKTHKSQRSLRSLRHREDLSTVRSVQRAATKASGRKRKRKTLDLPHKLNVYKNIEVGGRGAQETSYGRCYCMVPQDVLQKTAKKTPGKSQDEQDRTRQAEAIHYDCHS